jgi:RNA polymerase sigma factor (sigma-70 family)
MSQSDLETTLMLRVARGDAGAMTALFRHAYSDVRCFCARFTRDDDAADDLAQEVFMRVLRFAPGFRGDATFTTWAYRIARNVCHDHVARLARERRLAPAPASDAAVDGAADRVELLRRALNELSEEEREAVVLSRLRDLTYRQLADILECSEGAARVRVHRALRRLREILLQTEYADAL